jgi:hypothetical protein
MQPSTPPRQLSRWVNGHGVLTIPAVDSDYPKQFDGQPSDPTANARPNRSFWSSMRSSRTLALDHS